MNKKKLNLKKYIYFFDLCKKACRKLSVLAILPNCMSFEKRKISLKTVVES